MAIAVTSASTASTAAGDRLRVMVVDDSVVVRGLVARWLEEQPDFEVVASLRTGREAVDQVERLDPDVAILDIEMPVLDGISALPLLLAKKRDLVVIMASTLTRHNAEISLKALSLGAADYIPKPETNRGVTTSADFRRDLVEKVRNLGQRRRRQRGFRPAAPAPSSDERPTAGRIVPPVVDKPPTCKLRTLSPTIPRVLLIGSSTGGPQALNEVVGRLGSVIDKVPVLITQHMPPTFTTILAEHLSRASGRTVREGQDGEPVVAGRVYVAPGALHMQVARRDGGPVIVLQDGPLVNFCKPAVDPLLTSAAQVWGAATLAVILTGMGSDGARGAADLVAAGGSVIAQDEASSVVWGMPGAVAQAGLCAAILPLAQIASKVTRVFSGERS
ncbi:chemotaxis-specific protein-glutamate methyltransferase CheB [Rhodoplanes serenus]|uniref:Protein-glutamate methylesterase/protein-glutamine glutaminase n=1 Tax=Rhodoplanes serenus TaxID=200615 RepID=A0A9X5ATV7_9BRAD|nr:chemotaxis response regulator protein-glutamate methylesterase [Rhodoplanes serenus]MTW18811.1 chemotaxis-specific protein-glutamate methyltransferase CheB [Rhodoplanes serenus]